MSAFPLLDDDIKILAEDFDDLDEFDTSMLKDDDAKDDVQEKRGKEKRKSFISEFTASNTTINAKIVEGESHLLSTMQNNALTNLWLKVDEIKHLSISYLVVK